jgi:hypothetical protein
MWLTETELNLDKENHDYHCCISRVVLTNPFQAHPFPVLSNNSAHPFPVLSNNSTPMPSPSKAFATISEDKTALESNLKQDHLEEA